LPTASSPKNHGAMGRLEDVCQEALPSGPGSPLCALGVDVFPVKLSSARVDIHLGSAEPTLTFPGVTGNPKDKHTEERKVDVEEVLNSPNLLSLWQAKG
jgi:hypothetical protein